jgi:RNA polymerase sigma-70 factor (ECF subfamily)
MRELATRLVADPGAAEDVVQEACVAALTRPPEERGKEEAWLARVVRNFAWKRRRAERLRGEYERRAAVPEAVGEAPGTLERLELQRKLLGAIEALAEPFRTAVVERYLAARSRAELARALGVPEGTVRWRLKRGLDELRARLDAEHGRAAWSAWLAPLALPPASSSPPATESTPDLRPLLAPGVPAMLISTKITLASALGVAAVGIVLWQRSEEPRAAAHLEPPAAAPATLAAPPEVALEKDARPAVREARAEELPVTAAPVVEIPTAAPARAVGRLALRFVDAAGGPWSGVSLAQRYTTEALGTSAPDGHLELELAPFGDEVEWNVALVARRSGCASRDVRATLRVGTTTQLGDVLLGPGVIVAGRVLDEEGRGIAGADVGLGESELPELDITSGEVSQPDEGLLRRVGSRAFEGVMRTKSAADGTFKLEGAEPGLWRPWGHASGKRYDWGEPLEVRAGEDVAGLELVLPDELTTDRIAGVVLDPEGAPVPKAQILMSCSTESEVNTTSATAGHDGRFEFVLRRELALTLLAADPEHHHADAVLYDVAPGTRGIELRLGPLTTFDVAVHDLAGAAIRDCRLTLTPTVGFPRAKEAPPEAAPGLYRVAKPAVPFELVVEAPGFRPERHADLDPLTLGTQFDVVLAGASTLRGRVLAGGRPVAGARVTLHHAIVERGVYQEGFECAYERTSASETTCAGDGSFTLTCPGSGPVYLRASARGLVDADAGPFEPLAAPEVTLELTEGGALEGRVLNADGTPAAGAVVGIHHGDGRPRTRRVGPDGLYRFDALVPGEWSVELVTAEIDPSSSTSSRSSRPAAFDPNCTIRAGRVTRFDLERAE